MRQAIYLIVCIGVILAGAAGPAAAKRYALVVGNNGYANVPALQKAVNDADAMAKTLEAVGFSVLRATDVARRELNRKLDEFTSQLQPGDEALFYYAGHGVEIAGQNYLLPTDIPSAQPGKEDLIKRESIAVHDVLDSIRSRGARVSILVLDACRDNPFPARGTRSLGGSRGLARMPAPEGTFIMYSAGVGQTALDRLSDNDPNPNSVFTRSLIPLLQQPGLSLPQTARQVRRDVQALAKTISHDQRPAYYDEVTGDFFFKPGEAAPAVKDVSISRQEALSFVAYLHSQAPVDDMAGFVERHYARIVHYYDKGRISRADVLADKRNWFRRWSQWSLSAEDATVSLRPRPDGTFELEYLLDYRWVGKPDTKDAGKTLKGRAITKRVVRKTDGRIVIETETASRVK